MVMSTHTLSHIFLQKKVLWNNLHFLNFSARSLLQEIDNIKRFFLCVCFVAKSKQCLFMGLLHVPKVYTLSLNRVKSPNGDEACTTFHS